jgi:hypothetical protein
MCPRWSQRSAAGIRGRWLSSRTNGVDALLVGVYDGRNLRMDRGRSPPACELSGSSNGQGSSRDPSGALISPAPTRDSGTPLLCGSRRVFRLRFLSSGGLACGPFRKLLASRFTIPFLERLVRDFSFNEKLRELAPLRLALERHLSVASTQIVAPGEPQLALPSAWVLRRLVEAELFGVRAFDGPTIALASGGLALVAHGAAMLPAWRAASDQSDRGVAP